MGSLMAGWDSPVLDSKSDKNKRNWSFTKEEIDSYWKLKKKVEEEHLKAISTDSTQLQRSISMPEGRTMKAEKNLEEFILKNGWWTRSNWAFLNEPPVLERTGNSYAAQFHIANLAASKANNTGISAK